MDYSLADQRRYQAAADFLFERINYERKPLRTGAFRLKRMEWLLERLGNPHLRFPVIHLAGTKGKGSTSTMVAQMLESQGLRTGLYTSPHLVHFEERFQVHRQPIPRTELAALVEEIRARVPELDTSPATRPTFFELTTALGVAYFAQREVDWGIIEVGLGGRLDSTNVVSPVVTAITSIGYDHQGILGNRLEQIAAEKGGIIKPGIPLISGVIEEPACETIEQIAQDRGALVRRLHRDFEYRSRPSMSTDLLRGASTGGGPDFGWESSFDYRDIEGHWHEGIGLRMVGEHQMRNASVALAILEDLSLRGLLVADWSARRNGLKEVSCQGRLQWIEGSPPVLLDVSHNMDSIKALVDVVQKKLALLRRVIVFGCSADKDAKGMLEALQPVADRLVLTRYTSNPRQVDPLSLLPYVARQATPPLALQDPLLAFEEARQIAGREGVVIVCGSFFLAAEILRYLDSHP
jgi:dihydrofolate synthase/folylpolyglutamate synthase